MCSPMAVGAGISIASTLIQSQAQSRAANSEAKVAWNNANLAKQQGADAKLRGVVEASEIEAAGRRAASSAVAQAAGMGLSTTSGPATLAESQSLMNAAADAELARNKSAREAWGFDSEAAEHRFRTRMIREGAANNMVGGLLGTGGQVAGMYMSSKAGK